MEYSWVKATIGICMLVDYFVAKKRQHSSVVELVLGCSPDETFRVEVVDELVIEF
jgi:hypothetical protein